MAHITEAKAALYLTSSRRTSFAASAAVAYVFGAQRTLRLLAYTTRGPGSPVWTWPTFSKGSQAGSGQDGGVSSVREAHRRSFSRPGVVAEENSPLDFKLLKTPFSLTVV